MRSTKIHKPLKFFMTAVSFCERAPIKKITVTVPPGYMNLDDARSTLDVLDMSRFALRSLEVTLSNENGNDLDSQGRDDSCH